MERLSTVLPSVLEKRGIAHHAFAALVCRRAEAWLGANLPAVLHDHLRIGGYRSGELCITTATSLAAQECQLAVPALQKALQEECGLHAPKRIVVRRASLA